MHSVAVTLSIVNRRPASAYSHIATPSARVYRLPRPRRGDRQWHGQGSRQTHHGHLEITEWFEATAVHERSHTRHIVGERGRQERRTSRESVLAAGVGGKSHRPDDEREVVEAGPFHLRRRVQGHDREGRGLPGGTEYVRPALRIRGRDIGLDQRLLFRHAKGA